MGREVTPLPNDGMDDTLGSKQASCPLSRVFRGGSCGGGCDDSDVRRHGPKLPLESLILPLHRVLSCGGNVESEGGGLERDDPQLPPQIWI